MCAQSSCCSSTVLLMYHVQGRGLPKLIKRAMQLTKHLHATQQLFVLTTGSGPGGACHLVFYATCNNDSLWAAQTYEKDHRLLLFMYGGTT